MKLINKVKIFILLAMTFSFSMADAGNSVNNGGDTVVAEFKAKAQNLMKALSKKSGLYKKNSVLIDNLREAVRTTKVVSQTNVFIDGIEYDAINNPEEKHIIVSSTRWTLPTKKEKLILHEYLWVAGVDDSDYATSTLLIEQIKRSEIVVFPWL